MNRYDYEFSAVCPVDGDAVVYQLAIETKRVIQAEEIRKAGLITEPLFHEQIADNLGRVFGGKQTLVATHRGVKITTERWGRP